MASMSDIETQAVTEIGSQMSTSQGGQSYLRKCDRPIDYHSEKEEMSRFEKDLSNAMKHFENDIVSSNVAQYETYTRWFSGYLDKVARSFLQSLAGRNYSVRKLLKLPWPPQPQAEQDLASVSQMHILIVEILRNLNNRGVSLDTICSYLTERDIISKDESEIISFKIVFKIISWITLLFKSGDCLPLDAGELVMLVGSNSGTHVAARHARCEINGETMGLYLHHLLAHFGNFVPPQCLPRLMQRHCDAFEDSVISTSINYHTLSTIAQIRIEWVDTISLHMEFDEKALVLRLFRYPSFCAMHYFRGTSEDTLISSLFPDPQLESNFSGLEDWVPFTRSFFLEVLCSYRLIFGQHPKSHKSFERIRPTPGPDAPAPDPLLRQLCGRSCFDNTFYAGIGGPRVKTMYSARGDFPNLGKRLLELQGYMNAQNPQDLVALWYDRRDVLRFYTFWAVVVVGGLSIFLSAIQTVLTAVQLAKM